MQTYRQRKLAQLARVHDNRWKKIRAMMDSATTMWEVLALNDIIFAAGPTTKHVSLRQSNNGLIRAIRANRIARAAMLDNYPAVTRENLDITCIMLTEALNA